MGCVTAYIFSASKLLEAMADKYANFRELEKSEPKGSYFIDDRAAGTKVALIAPHAGGIEPGTSAICKSVAGSDLTYYLFEGKKLNGNQDLHITSSNFDEPVGVAIAQSAQVVVTFHGQRGEKPFVNVGGLAEVHCSAMIQALNNAGYPARKHDEHWLQGRNKNNICNRGQTGQGIQLEISRALRDLLTSNTKSMAHFSSTVRTVLDRI